jgi:hypothetical protein
MEIKMKKLNEIIWSEFYIGGDNGLFKITSTSSGIDKNKLILSNDGKIPYITRTETNNGINHFVGDKQKANYKIDKGNVITIGLDTQTVFYQEKDFYTGQNIQVIKHKELNKFNGFFVIPLLKIQMEKFNWGGNGATLGRLSRTKIMLPIDDKEKPDYEYMEQYTKAIIDEKIAKYTSYAESMLNSIEVREIEKLEEKEWKEFFLTSIFSKIQRGKRLTTVNQMDGNKPYVSSTALNNGIDNFISNKESVRIFSDCLTIANSGSVGASFYHQYEFVASDHITHLKQEGMSKFIYLFISTLTNGLSKKYNFNREINDKRISREKILLPVNEKEEPDYEYMEQYAKNLMHKKITQYLDYLQKQNS